MWGIKLSPRSICQAHLPPAWWVLEIKNLATVFGFLVCKRGWWVIHNKPPAPKATGGTPYKITDDECEP